MFDLSSIQAFYVLKRVYNLLKRDCLRVLFLLPQEKKYKVLFEYVSRYMRMFSLGYLKILWIDAFNSILPNPLKLIKK